MEITSYPAVLKKAQTRVPGHVRLLNRQLLFSASGATSSNLAWDEFSLIAAFEGNVIVVHSAQETGEHLIVSDPRFAADLEAALGVRVASSAVHWWARRPQLSGLAATLTLFTVVFLSLMLLRSQGKVLAAFVSAEQEAELGRQAFDELYTKKVITLPAPMLSEWEALTSKLFSQPSLSAYRWKLYIAKDEEVNAFAMPGGHIVLNAGLIQQSDSAEELLGVLAHEAAHITERHGIQSLAGEVSSAWISSVLFGGNLFGAIVGVSEKLASLTYTRAHEREADSKALDFLKSAGISSRGFAEFFARSRKNSESILPKWASTHPLDQERIDSLRAITSGAEVPRMDFDLAGLKAALN